MRRSASITSSMPLRRTRRPSDSSRGRSPRGAAGPSGVNRAVSTPHGTTAIRRRGAPIRTSSNTSSVQVASTRSAWRATASSARTRPPGLVSSAPWWRRFTLPSAWKVCTAGNRSRAAARATIPDIQKWPCTMSGGSAVQASSSTRVNAGRCGTSSSFGTDRAGPAATWRTTTPGRTGTASGAASSSRRVHTVISCPLSASAELSSRTWTFCPPASAPPSAASGLACSETIAMRMRISPFRS
jgi:hypothetical protein